MVPYPAINDPCLVRSLAPTSPMDSVAMGLQTQVSTRPDITINIPTISMMVNSLIYVCVLCMHIVNKICLNIFVSARVHKNS